MEVLALKTFLNSTTRTITRAGDTLTIDDNYAGDLAKRGIVEQQGATTGASARGAVPQPQRTAAMAGAPFVGSKLDGQAAASSSSARGPASPPKTVVTPAPAASKR